MTDLHAGGRASATAASLTESVIREMTRLALQHNAINLAQGFPDFPAPEEVKRAAVAAIEADLNQYPITWGQRSIREALADKYRNHYGLDFHPEREVCVTCGATEAMVAAMIGCVDPGQEVIVFEPFYENYGAAAAIAGAVPRYVTLREPGWWFDEAELAAAFTSRTRAIVINTSRFHAADPGHGRARAATTPAGAYYIMCDASVLGMGDDTATARALTREVGVATVPGSSFYSRPERGRSKIRFSYSKKLATLHEAGRRLARLATDPA